MPYLSENQDVLIRDLAQSLCFIMGEIDSIKERTEINKIYYGADDLFIVEVKELLLKPMLEIDREYMERMGFSKKLT